MNKMEWEKFFPYKEARNQQNLAINSILNNFNNDKKYFILEAGTGVGKSAIGLTAAQYVINNKLPFEGYESGVYFVTTQKLLQEQYIKDFSKFGMASIKSSVNYQCNFKKHISCSDGQNEIRTMDSSSTQWKTCTFNCNYKIKKQEFIDSKLSITNFSYLLTVANYGNKIKPRQLLIIDEAHNIETELSKFIEINVSEKFSKDVLHLDFPTIETQNKAYKWIEESYWPKLKSYLNHMNETLEKFHKVKENLEQFLSLSKQINLLETHYQKIEQFIKLYDQENWVFENLSSEKKGYKKFNFKPIDVSEYAKQYLFRLGYQVLFMSATILDSEKFSNSLGISTEECGNISIPSPFPIENKPIIYAPIGKMSTQNIDSTLNNLISAIESILQEHKNEKGIIHTHSYKISNYIKDNLKSKRLLFSTSDNKNQIIERHLKSKTATVLVSPSMTEGVDLEGEASNFQIICKVPFPYLGDKLVKKRMNKWKWWYSFQTAKTVIQSVGRSIRSQEDKAVTYILDQNWEYFYNRNKSVFPEDFKKSILM
jgi:ATP-dependent DNA helicase DinG